jgi:hypothetical protein
MTSNRFILGGFTDLGNTFKVSMLYGSVYICENIIHKIFSRCKIAATTQLHEAHHMH